MGLCYRHNILPIQVYRNKALNEAELVKRCKVGDRQAQKELYEGSVHRIYGLLLKLAGNEHDALDLAQDTYIRAFQRIDQFDEKAAFATWLYRIAHNEALQFLKNQARRTKKDERFLREKGLTGSAFANSQEDERNQVRAALFSLTPDEQAILLLRYHEGLDYRRLAEVLECSPGTVASRLNRARARLKATWEMSHRMTEET